MDYRLPVDGLVKTFDPDLTQPVSLYHHTDNPSGTFKTNLWFGGDNEVHEFNNAWSLWPDAASSRAGGSDLQTYSDQKYNGTNPFSTGPSGLTITTAKNPTVTALTPNKYTSGIITTQFSLVQKYGYFETQVTLANTKGVWPGFWLLGLPYTEYQADEIDIFEYLGGKPGHVMQNAHCPRLNWNAPSVEAADYGNTFTSGLLWTPDHLAWYVNGNQTNTCPNPGFHHPMYMLFNAAVGPNDGGSWSVANTPVDDAHLPAQTVLHSIRAWRLDDG